MKSQAKAHWLLSAILTFFIAFTPAGAYAQMVPQPNTAKFQLFEFGNAITGDRLKIDQEFSLRHKIAVPAAFSVLVPREDDVLRAAENAPEGPTGPFLKLSFTTTDNQLIENIRLIPMSIAQDVDKPEQLQGLATVLSGEIYNAVVQGATRHVRDVVRQTKIGGLPAVEVIGRYEDPALGLVYLRIVGIPNPNGPAGVMAVSKVLATRLELSNPNDFVRTRGGVMLREFRFLRAN